MWKHIITFFTVIFILSLGYGLWLYSESLRTDKPFSLLLKQDLAVKQQAINNLFAGDSDK